MLEKRCDDENIRVTWIPLHSERRDRIATVCQDHGVRSV